MIYILAPAYNEAPNFELLAKSITRFVKEKMKIIIVDDGSTDETAKVIDGLSKKYSITRIGYKNNKGAGYAFKFGLEYLLPKTLKEDLIITMESDNTGDYKILPKIINLSRQNKIIITSPHIKGGAFMGVGTFRIKLSQFAAYLDSIIFGIKNVRTYSSFYRVYPAPFLIQVKKKYGTQFITHKGFSAMVELLIKLDKIGAQIVEVPAVVDWRKRKGQSKMNIKRNTFNHFQLYMDFFQGKFG